MSVRSRAGKQEGSGAAITRASSAASSDSGVRLDVTTPRARRTTPIETRSADGGCNAGKIAEIGVSNHASWEILEMIALSEKLGARPPAISQVLYNVLVRQIEIEHLRFAERYRVHTTVYNPVAGGLLARDPAPGTAPPPGSRFASNASTAPDWTDGCTNLRLPPRRATATAAPLSSVLLVNTRPGVGSCCAAVGVAHPDAALAAWAKPLRPSLASADEIHLALTGTDARYAR